jgi:ABC-type Fe3+-hydroxamate transport system substrate-binding protein
MLNVSRGWLLVLLVVLSACASGAQGAQEGRSGSSMIGAEEIRRSPATNVLDLVRSERPQWLRTRGATTVRTRDTQDATGETVTVMDLPEIRVYVDGTRAGDTPELRGISTRGLVSVEFLSGPQATGRFGTDHPHGAILITTTTG